MSDQLQREESGYGIASVRALGLILGQNKTKQKGEE